MRFVSYAHMAIPTRFLVPSLFMRLARWVLTVLRLMWSLLLPRGERFDRLGQRLTGP
jgi:hypothetical protein